MEDGIARARLEPGSEERGALVRVGPGVRRQLANTTAAPVRLLALGGDGEHTGRDATAFASWQDTEGGAPQDIPLPEDLPVG